jgi:hypothetical protein
MKATCGDKRRLYRKERASIREALHLALYLHPGLTEFAPFR